MKMKWKGQRQCLFYQKACEQSATVVLKRISSLRQIGQPSSQVLLSEGPGYGSIGKDSWLFFLGQHQERSKRQTDSLQCTALHMVHSTDRNILIGKPWILTGVFVTAFFPCGRWLQFLSLDSMVSTNLIGYNSRPIQCLCHNNHNVLLWIGCKPCFFNR